MKTILLAAGAAALALSAGPTLAAHKSKMASVAGPKQPIPYSQLNAYLKASPKQRMAKNWLSGENSGALATAGADTASANASATTSASPSLPGDTAASATSATAPSASSGTPMPATPPVSTPSAGSTGPSPTTTPGSSSPETTPPK